MPDGMVSATHLRNRIRDAGYAFHRQADRVAFHRKGVVQVAIPRRDFVPEAQARSILQQAGLSEEDVRSFLAACRA